LSIFQTINLATKIVNFVKIVI